MLSTENTTPNVKTPATVRDWHPSRVSQELRQHAHRAGHSANVCAQRGDMDDVTLAFCADCIRETALRMADDG
jgi:hypothetical protein